MTQLVDSHAHLGDKEFDADREAVIERARAAGLKYLLLIGDASQTESWTAAAAITASYHWIFMAAGVHPHQAAEVKEEHFAGLRDQARYSKMLAIGEIGLDSYHDHSPRETQQRILVRQLELARELNLPVIIHCREAWNELRPILHHWWRPTGLGGILHCFTGTREDAFDLMDMGFYVSFAGNLTFTKAEHLRAVAREIPLDRLLSETDCPYLAPVPHRGKRNEPAYVQIVIRHLAALRGLDEEEMGLLIIANFRRLFRLD